MEIPAEFIEMVEKDIELIDAVLAKGDNEKLELFRELDGKYQACINGWGKSMYGYLPDYDFIDTRNLSGDSLDYNLKYAKSKLQTYTFGMNAFDMPKQSDTIISIDNHNTVQVNITFDDVRSQIDDMTSLTDEETRELLEKVNKLEEIVNSNEKKKTKWQMVSPILKWLADKSFDAAMTILPLILKLQG